jgi:hypothetical protein
MIEDLGLTVALWVGAIAVVLLDRRFPMRHDTSRYPTWTRWIETAEIVTLCLIGIGACLSALGAVNGLAASAIAVVFFRRIAIFHVRVQVRNQNAWLVAGMNVRREHPELSHLPFSRMSERLAAGLSPEEIAAVRREARALQKWWWMGPAIALLGGLSLVAVIAGLLPASLDSLPYVVVFIGAGLYAALLRFR